MNPWPFMWGQGFLRFKKDYMNSFESANLKKLVESLDLDYRENSVSYIFTCPRCDKNKKLYIRKRDGVFICFRCGPDGFRGRAEKALVELSGRPYREIQLLLYGEERHVPDSSYLEIDIKNFFHHEEEDIEQPDNESTFWPLDYFDADSPQFKKGLDYLESRGVPLEIAKEYGIRYNPARQRISFPIIVNGRLKGWQARYIKDTEIEQEDGSVVEIPKSLIETPFKDRSFVMFQDNLIGSDHCVLTEGPFDAIKMHLCKGNVAAMGKGIRKSQLAAISQYGIKRLYIGFDRDAASDIMRIAREMWQKELFFIQVPEGKNDLGDCSFEEGLKAFEDAERITPSRLFVHLK